MEIHLAVDSTNQNEFVWYRQRTENADAAEPSSSVYDGEWLLRSSLIWGKLAKLRTFRSQGVLLNPISNQNSKAQIL